MDKARILLIIGGGIAAYKALELIRRFRERGANVTPVLTRAATQFVTPLSVASLSGQAVRSDLFDLEDEVKMGHIALSREVDLIVIAPATAHLLAKMAQGLADDLASTVLLATDKPVLAAPAMNVRMWHHPATQRNITQLRADGVMFVGPEEGDMACGEFGLGRMTEPGDIVAAVDMSLQATRRLAGLHVLITAGPTWEAIDPVRFIANRSSGLQGYALARAAHAAGARVTLVSGPVPLAPPPGVKGVQVESARDMLAAVQAALPADVFIATAAVADWRVEPVASEKIKKTGAPPALSFVENPDILAFVGGLTQNRPRVVVGFAAETQDLLRNAQEKLKRKQCDIIVANGVPSAFGASHNQVEIVSSQGHSSWPVMTKDQVARRLMVTIADYGGFGS